MCSCHLSFLSGLTPKTHADGLWRTVVVGRVRGHKLLCFVCVVVKSSRIYISWANNARCFLAHTVHCLWTPCKVLQFSSIDLPEATTFTLSTKLVPEAGRVGGLQFSTQLAL